MGARSSTLQPRNESQMRSPRATRDADEATSASWSHATRTDEEHNATLFGDVRTTDEMVALFNAGPNA
jgi:hypothetical protein